VPKGSIIYIMFRNYFKTAIRNLWKSKGFSFINIFGLNVGMAVAMVIGFQIIRAAVADPIKNLRSE
jgi:hypothetical protein